MKDKNKNPLILIDWCAIGYRYLYALHNKYSQEETINKFLTHILILIKKIIKKHQAENIIICLDDQKKNINRYCLFSNYKYGRRLTPEYFHPTMKMGLMVLGFMNIPSLKINKAEADDVIYSLTQKFKSREVYIVSSDKDLWLLTSKKNISVIFDFQNLEPRKQEWLLQYLSLPNHIDLSSFFRIVGDSSDKMKGVRGVGRVQAVNLLSRFKDIDGIWSNISKIPSKTQNLLKQSKRNLIWERRIFKLKSFVVSKKVLLSLVGKRVKFYNEDVINFAMHYGLWGIIDFYKDEEAV